jgi:hypothetical protein
MTKNDFFQIFKVFQSTSSASSKEEGAGKEESGGNADAADSQVPTRPKVTNIYLQVFVITNIGLKVFVITCTFYIFVIFGFQEISASKSPEDDPVQGCNMLCKGNVKKNLSALVIGGRD